MIQKNLANVRSIVLISSNVNLPMNFVAGGLINAFESHVKIFKIDSSFFLLL